MENAPTRSRTQGCYEGKHFLLVLEESIPLFIFLPVFLNLTIFETCNQVDFLIPNLKDYVNRKMFYVEKYLS